MLKLVKNFVWGRTGERQSMLIEDGIVRVRTGEPIPAPEGCDVEDARGASLIPKFVESHCHILPTGLDLHKLHLGAASSHAEVLDLVSRRHKDQPEGWLLAVHYDQTKYGGAHLTLAELDSIDADRPILLRHSNGHAGVANSAALRLAGVDENTKDPAGGKFGRSEDGRLNGILFERALEIVGRAIDTPTLDQMTDAIVAAGRRMARQRIGCASDMMTGSFDLARELAAYRAGSLAGCPISMRLYVQWSSVFGARGIGKDRLDELNRDLIQSTAGGCRIAGIKIFADGAIGSGTAAIYGRYAANAGVAFNSVNGIEVSGQLIYSPTRLREMVMTADDAGFQVAVHSIGDYSTDLVLDAFEATGNAGRHRIEHAMILSDSQIERIARLGCFVTFQPEFLKCFAHSYERQLGPERAAKLKRLRSALDAGIRVSLSSDQPIVPGDPMDGIATAVARPPGFDPAEACTLAEAIDSYTILGACVNGDDPRLLSLDAGSPAEYSLIG